MPMKYTSEEKITFARGMVNGYRQAKAKIHRIEKMRARLLSMVGISPEWTDYNSILPIINADSFPMEDRSILAVYRESRMTVDIVETAIHERLEKKYRTIADDMVLQGTAAKDIILRHQISLRTVRRVKQKVVISVVKELTTRQNYGFLKPVNTPVKYFLK